MAAATRRQVRRRRSGARVSPGRVALLALLLVANPAPATTAVAVTTTDDCAARLAAPLSPTAHELTLPLRIAVWNSKKFERRGASTMLRQLGAFSDLLLLQESLDDAPVTRQAWRLFAPGYRRDGLRSGVELRANVSADLRCALQFTEPWLRSPKAVAVARFALRGGAPLLVVNLHAINFTVGSRAYREQFAAVGDLLKAHRGPAVIGGDFNHWNAWRTRVLNDFARRHGLSPLDISPDWRSRHLGQPVDGVLLRGLRGIGGAALPTRSSDHNPLIGSLLPLPPDPPAAAGDSGAAAG